MIPPLDAGLPIPAHRPGTDEVLSLDMSVCPGARCGLLHLRAEGGGEVRRLDVDVETWKIRGADEADSAWLASEGAWIAPWVADHTELLRRRFDRLEAQALEGVADARPAPPWKPGERILHRTLFPHDFAPAVDHEGRSWLIEDGYSPDPSDRGDEVALRLFAPDGTTVEVEGQLGSPRPTKGGATARALWEAIHADEDLVELLGDRRDDVRAAGPFVVGEAYEKARVARRAVADAPPLDDRGGYLQGGAVPDGLVRRLFETGARLHAARFDVPTGWRSWFRVEASGPLPYLGWARVREEPPSIDLHTSLHDAEPELSLTLVPRGDMSLQARRQRSALGLPLLGGTVMPLVERVDAAGEYAPADADDVRFVVAVAEAILAAPRDEIFDVAGAPRVFDHRVEMDTGPIDVRLTASPAEAPWPAKPALDDVARELEAFEDDFDTEAEDTDDLDLDDAEEDAESVDADAVVEAFTDAALDRGIPEDVIDTARSLLDAIVSYASNEMVPFFREPTWEAFLTDYVPRRVALDEQDIARAPAALRAAVDWLGDVGHLDARRFRSLLDRTLPVFQKRARDPRRFSPAKATVMEMRAAGVDLGDQASIDRFLAARNRGLPASARSPATSPAAVTVSRSPTRWAPAPGEPAPKPTDPCGCGSGRRYKKCCMPR